MVEDNGEGISAEDKDHIFSRFYRTASARATENQGSGLGLAIVKHLVNSLNGEVGIESKPQQGSVFWFTLPSHWKSEPLLLMCFTIKCHINDTLMSHKWSNRELLMVAIWNKFHAFMKAGRLDKVIKLSGINE